MVTRDFQVRVRRIFAFSGFGGSIRNVIAIAFLGLAIAAPASAAKPAAKTKPARLTQALWVANGANVVEFGPAQLGKGVKNTKPLLTLNTTPAFTSTQGVLFDKTGNLWVIDGGATTPAVVPASLDMFTQTQLKNLRKKKSRTPAPTVTLTCTCFVFPQQAVFDSAGNLWVSDNDNGGQGAVDMFAASLLTTSAAVTPTASFTSTSFSGPLGIVFDSAGNLWIANNGGTSIVEFDSASLPAAGTVGTSLIPNVMLSTNQSSIEGPWALIFDSTGNLWSSNANTPFTLVEFASTDLTASGSPPATTTISPTTVGKKKSPIPTLNSPNGIAFDTTGSLGVANSVVITSVARFLASQLATGTVVPQALVSGKNTGLTAPAGDNFGPVIR